MKESLSYKGVSMPDLPVFAPADGKLVALEQVPDPAFSEHMLGDGIAVAPVAGFTAAPFDGKVISVHKALHAMVIGRPGLEVLIHIGVETVNLQGKGFRVLVNVGEEVKKGQHLTEFDPHFIAKHAPSNLIILLVTTPDGTQLHKQSAESVKAGQDVVFSVPLAESALPSQQTADSKEEQLFSRPVTISNLNGLHARPAGRLAEAAKKYDFPILITCAKNTANAKSLVAIMGLSLSRGQEVRLCAPQSEPAAAHALEELAQLLESGLGEDLAAQDQSPACSVDNPCLCNAAHAPDFSQPAILKALTACVGIAQGKAFLFTAADIAFEQTAADPQTEQTRLTHALEQTAADFSAEMKTAASAAAKEILQAHAELLKDPFLLEQAHAQIQQGKSAPFAFNEAIRASIDVLKKTKNRFLLERIADFKDLRRRVLIKLTGSQSKKPDFPEGCIVIADELLPSDLALFDHRVHGVVLAYGSPTAHVSILLRNMGLPALVGAGECILNIKNGTPLAIHAAEGLIYIHPTSQQTAQLTDMMRQEKAAREANQKAASQPALTQDGTHILVCGNASNEREALAAAENGADGLGLVRTEFLFFQSKEAPSQQRQFMLYQNIVAALHGQPVTLRTLDVGGDKPVPYMPLPAEENPIVGLRGIRNYKDYRDIFLTQIRAMLRVQPAAAVRIMLPMVTFVEEVVEYKRLIAQEKEKLGISTPIEIGIMVEVPAAAVMAAQFAAQADFFSLGTNDLTQYALAIDRGHKTLCAQADHLNPAVLGLIALTCQGAQQYKRPVAVCGAMAGDIQAIPLLIGLGVTELAVGANAIAAIKAQVRTLDRAHCIKAARQACALNSAAQVRELVKKEFGV